MTEYDASNHLRDCGTFCDPECPVGYTWQVAQALRLGVTPPERVQEEREDARLRQELADERRADWES